MKLSWKIQEKFYKLIRPLFVKDVDLNEDYNCMQCDKPVLRRFLFCSEKCSAKFDAIHQRGLI